MQGGCFLLQHISDKWLTHPSGSFAEYVSVGGSQASSQPSPTATTVPSQGLQELLITKSATTYIYLLSIAIGRKNELR